MNVELDRHLVRMSAELEQSLKYHCRTLPILASERVGSQLLGGMRGEASSFSGSWPDNSPISIFSRENKSRVAIDLVGAPPGAAEVLIGSFHEVTSAGD